MVKSPSYASDVLVSRIDTVYNHISRIDIVYNHIETRDGVDWDWNVAANRLEVDIEC